jgi:hypothetical protein
LDTACPADPTAISDIELPCSAAPIVATSRPRYQITRCKTGNLTGFLSFTSAEHESVVR